MSDKPCYPIIAGPTASGKTALAVAVATAVDGEVVSADSMQIYEGVSVGTARPSPTEMKGIPHHLMGFLPLTESYSVGRYIEDARSVFADVFARGRTPVLCGGTGLYIRSFMENISLLPQPADPAVRQRLQQEATVIGGHAMICRLAEIDPAAAARLHENDLHRIIRALEVYEVTGHTITQQAESSHRDPSPYSPCLFLLDFHDRSELYRRIDCRVEKMLEDGLIEEAKRVLQSCGSATVLQAIGYKEWLPYFRGMCSLNEAVQQVKTETRHYAKRQLSWFRRMDKACTFYVDDYDGTEQLAAVALQRFLDFRRREARD